MNNVIYRKLDTLQVTQLLILFTLAPKYRRKQEMASGSKTVIFAALIGNGLIAIAKFVGASITGSAAMIDQVNEVRTVHMGPEYILATISADFKDETRAGDLESANAEMDRRIKAAFPNVKHTFIEAEANDIAPDEALG